MGEGVPGGMASVVQDRLGSVGKYYPYGEMRDQPNDGMFATYTRDAATGNDYADQRYYSSALGRFMTPDPYKASGGPGDPQSWNQYAYTRGDPANALDPSGLALIAPESYFESWSIGDGDDEFNAGGGACGPGWVSDASLSRPCNPPPCSSFGSSFAPNPSPSPFCPTDGAEPQPPAPTPAPKVTSLRVILDCWLSVNPKTGAPSRETNFEAFDGDTPLGGLDIVITEAVTTKPGGPLATNWINDPGSSSPPNGIFEDEKGLRPNQWGPVTLYQSFTVSVDGGPAYSVPVVRGTTSSSYLTVQYTWDYRGSIGRWFKGRKDYNVIVKVKDGIRFPHASEPNFDQDSANG